MFYEIVGTKFDLNSLLIKCLIFSKLKVIYSNKKTIYMHFHITVK